MVEPECAEIWQLHCISEYPCPIDKIDLTACSPIDSYDNTVRGLSDHTAHVLTGAVAVGAGARVIESHVRLWDTPQDNPDYPHSLPLNPPCACHGTMSNPEAVHGKKSCGDGLRDGLCVAYYGPEDISGWYDEYVQNVRIAERML